MPTALNFDSTSGTISGTPTQSGTFQLSITAHNALGDSSPQIVTFYINVPPGISSPITPSAVVGTAFNYQITALPLALSYGATGLPGWLNADIVAGTITGTPPAAGHYIFNAVANNEAGQTVQPITLTVTGGTSVPVITSAATASGAVGAPFTYTITTSPAATRYTALVLPDGLQFNEPTGIILGTPTTAGTYQIPITATDATGTYASILTLTVAPPVAPSLVSPLTAIASPGYPFIFAIPTTGAVALYNETGALPDGLTFNTATGVISGTTTSTGTFPLGLTATNTTGTGTASLTLTVTSSTGFADWSAAHDFSGGPTGTPQGDGVPNLLKYIYNIDPTHPMSTTDRAALPTVGTTVINGTEELTLTFREYSQTVISQRGEFCGNFMIVNERIFFGAGRNDKIKRIAFGYPHKTFAFDYQLLGFFRQVEQSDIIFIQISYPMQPMSRCDNDGELFQLNTVIFPRSEHDSVLTEQHGGTISIVGEMMDTKLHKSNLAQPNLRCPVEPFRHVNRVPNRNRTGMDLISPYLKGCQLGIAESC